VSIDPVAHANWRIQQVRGVKLSFTSGSGCKFHLARYPNTARAKHNDDHTAVYEP